MSKIKISGKESFENYYSSLYKERWEKLRESLFLDPLYTEFSYDSLVPYHLDIGSFFAASCLPIENTEKILDMCAAPGGKTLVIASRKNLNTTLISNERSAERRNRLIKVINDSLPEQICNTITVTSFDGALMCKKYPEFFNAILLDAPCSSERHVIKADKYLEEWTSARIRNLSYTQWSLLSSAFLCLKNNGCLLYSTCALADVENDGIIKKLLKKYPNSQVVSIQIDELKSSLQNINNINSINPEKTEFGYHILPDTSNGAGPLFFCLIKKTNSNID